MRDSLISSGSPRPALSEVIAEIVVGLRDHRDEALLAAARTLSFDLPLAAVTGPALRAALAGPEAPLAPQAIRLLAQLDAPRALPLALALLAASEPDPAYEQALLVDLAARADRLMQAARQRSFFAWEPSLEQPASRWPSRLLAEAFPTSEALLAALRAPVVDGLGLLLRDLLWSAIALELGTWSGWDPGSTPDARISEKSESPFRSPAARVVAAAFGQGQVSAAQICAAARRGWLSVEWVLETLRAGKALKSAEKIVEALEASVGPARLAGEVAHAGELTRWLIGLAKKKPAKGAVAVLGHLWQAQDRLLRDEAGDALAALESPEANLALAAALPEVLDGDWASSHWPARLSIRAAVAAEPARATETLGTFFTAEALSTDQGQERARRIVGLRAGAGPKERWFEEDPRWLDLGALLLGGPLFGVARELLATFDAAAVQAALDRSGYHRPAARPRAAWKGKARPGWLARYEKGEHVEVWAEIGALDDQAASPALVEEAQAVARAMMKRVRTNLERIVKVLKKQRYAFDSGSPVKGLAPPAPEVGEQLADLEAMCEGPLPFSLRAFYEVVGSVDLGEQHEAEGESDFRGFGAYDPLAILPPAMALDFLRPLAEREERLPEALRLPPSRIFAGLDPATKADPGEPNDRPYRIEIAGRIADGLVIQGNPVGSFVDYLRRAIRAGGFLGLDTGGGAELGQARDLLTRGLLPF
jgi:hypothetical protein